LSKIKIGGIVKDLHLTLISLESSRDSNLSTTELLEELGQADINVSMIVQLPGEDGSQLTRLTVWQRDQEKTLSILGELQRRHPLDIRQLQAGVASLGIYGPDFRIRSGLGGAILRTLRDAQVDIQAISTSTSTFTVVIPSAQAEAALLAIQKNFEVP
jgi:aspartate kinase